MKTEQEIKEKLEFIKQQYIKSNKKNPFRIAGMFTLLWVLGYTDEETMRYLNEISKL